MNHAYTATTVIERDADEVFRFVSDAENQPRWAINFVRSTRALGGGRYTMETPVGELAYRLDADPARRVVDWVFETPAGETVMPARVVPHPAGAVFSFTIPRMPDADDAAWEQGRHGLDEELATLKALLERQ
ncbi:MAG: SRPBCC family protein [Actinomycetota bacterium]|nr:SRPBCC family protein [Actinomycetota bacterium]